MNRQVACRKLAFLALIATITGGCAQGTAFLNPENLAEVEHAEIVSDIVCHDLWPQIAISAVVVQAARAPGRRQVSYPAHQMLTAAVDQVTARLRCPEAVVAADSLTVAPRDMYVRNIGPGPRYQYAAVNFDLAVMVEGPDGQGLADWYIMPWTRISREPVRTGLASPGKMLQILEPELTSLTYEAMTLAIEMALECFRELQDLPMLRPDIFADSGYQCLPPGPERRRQTLGQRMIEQARQQQ